MLLPIFECTFRDFFESPHIVDLFCNKDAFSNPIPRDLEDLLSATCLLQISSRALYLPDLCRAVFDTTKYLLSIHAEKLPSLFDSFLRGSLSNCWSPSSSSPSTPSLAIASVFDVAKSKSMDSGFRFSDKKVPDDDSDNLSDDDPGDSESDDDDDDDDDDEGFSSVLARKLSQGGDNHDGDVDSGSNFVCFPSGPVILFGDKVIGKEISTSFWSFVFRGGNSAWSCGLVPEKESHNKKCLWDRASSIGQYHSGSGCALKQQSMPEGTTTTVHVNYLSKTAMFFCDGVLTSTVEVPESEASFIVNELLLRVLIGKFFIM
jgi:hypothetical protein